MRIYMLAASLRQYKITTNLCDLVQCLSWSVPPCFLMNVASCIKPNNQGDVEANTQLFLAAIARKESEASLILSEPVVMRSKAA